MAKANKPGLQILQEMVLLQNLNFSTMSPDYFKTPKPKSFSN